MRKLLTLSALAVSWAFTSSASVPPVEKLLPNDTLMVVTAPDCVKLRNNFTNSPGGMLWNDPAMKPFHDNFVKKFNADVVAPLEKELGIRFNDYVDLSQGEFALGVVQNGADAKPEEKFAVVLLLDVKDKKDKLKANLADVKKKWIDAGKELKADKIRDLDSMTLITTGTEINKTFQKLSPGASNDDADAKDDKKADDRLEVTFVQSDSLLIIANSTKAIEKILARQAGGQIPALADNATFQKDQAGLFRDADWFFWLNAKPLLDLATQKSGNDNQNAMGIKPDKALGALGLNGVKSLALTYHTGNDGSDFQVFVGAPEGERRGLLKVLAADAKDSNPPPFVPADAVKFNRWRLDLQKAWSGLENMLTEITPAATGVLRLVFENAGKDQDPNFDLRKELIGNLGDDIIAFERAGKDGANVSTPSLYLISSPNPEKLARAFKVGISSLGGAQGPDFKEREFLGRKIYTAGTPPALAGSTGKTGSLSFSASGGYLAVSSSASMLEEYLRSSEGKGKSLNQAAGLAEAAQKVGGMGTGLFGYTSQSEQMRTALDNIKKDGADPSALLGTGGPLSAKVTENKKLKEWFDFSLLPPYDAIAKYFGFTVYAGSFDGNGFRVKYFSPTPPQLKK